MLNVNTNRKTINASKNTIAPITYVPTIILHVNGRPFMRYLGPAEPESLKRFVVEVSQKLQNKQKFSSENVKEEPRGRIPEFTIGHPLYGNPDDMRTYLDFDEAYENKK